MQTRAENRGMARYVSEISGARGIAKSTCHKRRGKRDGRDGKRQGERERKKDSDRGRSKKHWHVLVPTHRRVPENARYPESRPRGGRYRERRAIEPLKEAEKGAKRARNAKRK